MSNITIDKPHEPEPPDERGYYAQFGCGTGYIQFDWTASSDIAITVNGVYTADAHMCRVLSSFLESRWQSRRDDDFHAAQMQMYEVSS